MILDRDDTILDDPGYLSDPGKVKFLPGAVEGLVKFHQAGWPLVVVTNQSGIGRGYYGLAELEAVHERFQSLLAESGVKLAAIYFCPHGPDDGCDCRKPEPALALRAAQELNLELKQAVVVGDKVSDLELGRRIEASFVAQIVAKRSPASEADEHFQDLAGLAQKMLG